MENIFSELDLIIRYPFRPAKQHILIDVGCHHGGVSLSFAKKGWHVISFEPEEKNRAAFIKNLAGFERVICIPKAVSNTSSSNVPFYVSEEHFGIHSLKPFHKTHKLAYEVETVCLDDVLYKMGISTVTLLKIDTEGADFLALRGFDVDKYNPELIMVEFMDERSISNFGYSHHDVVHYMTKRGYKAFVSEWAPIKEYGREGVPGVPHTWLQCVPYPLDHEPAWGNLLFVPDEDSEKFTIVLEDYLANPQGREENIMRKFVKRILGTVKVFTFLMLHKGTH